MKYLDANIFIYVLDLSAKKEFSRSAETILKGIEDGERAVISSITLMEVLWWCEKYLKEKIKDTYEMILSYDNLKTTNVTADIIEDAIFYKYKYGLELNDCISLSLMVAIGIKEIYSNDSGFDDIEWIKRLF